MTNESLQVPGGKCADKWHVCGTLGATGSACTSCGAVMMAGGPVTADFHAEYQRRLAAGVCVASSDGRFRDSRKASKKALASGACLCAYHNR